MQWLKLTTPGNHEIFINMSLAVHMRRFGEKTSIDMLTSAMDRTHAIGVMETPEQILQKMCDCGWVSKQDIERATTTPERQDAAASPMPN
ncbi:hypothetical protein [Methylopila sp. M107]|uniref:hypothetical protein n=1 Tax=Methylopila sp. M107 TaxID=1101190 RepID=UPI0003752DDC|nr:hypothetical protein [Methylopila sp. M107]